MTRDFVHDHADELLSLIEAACSLCAAKAKLLDGGRGEQSRERFFHERANPSPHLHSRFVNCSMSAAWTALDEIGVGPGFLRASAQRG